MKNELLAYMSLILVGVFFNNSACAELYKWIDEDGNTHYSQSPPTDNSNAQTMTIKSDFDNKSAIQELERKKKKVEKLRDDRISAKEEKQKTKEEKLEKDKKCTLAKNRLASYQRPRVNVKNTDGSMRVLAEEERQQEISKSKEIIKSNCE